MKRLGLLFALALLVGCGGSAVLVVQQLMAIGLAFSGIRIERPSSSAFTTSLKQSSTSAVTVTNFTITVMPPCAVESPVGVTAELDGASRTTHHLE